MLAEAKLVYAFLPGIGAGELLVIFAIVLLLFGGKKLPEVARSMGQALRAFKEEANKLKRDVELEAEKEDAQGQTQGSSPTAAGKAEPDKSKVEPKA